MTAIILSVTKEELTDLIETIVEQKLGEWFDGLEEDLPLQDHVYQRLLRQKQAVVAGERGQSFDDVVQRLHLG